MLEQESPPQVWQNNANASNSENREPEDSSNSVIVILYDNVVEGSLEYYT